MKKIFLSFKSFIPVSLSILIIAGMNGCKPGSDSNTDLKKDSTKTGSIRNEDINKRITIEIKSKDFQHGDPKVPSDDKDYQVINYGLTNNTNKNIKQVEADILINDLAGNLIKKVSFSFVNGVPANGKVEYKCLYNFNAFNEKEVMLKSVDVKSLKIDVSVVRIGYSDGTVETLLVN